MKYPDKTKMIDFFEKNLRLVNTNHEIREVTFTYVKGRNPAATFTVITENSLTCIDGHTLTEA